MNPRWLGLVLGGLTMAGLGVAARMTLWPLAAPRFSEPTASAAAPQGPTATPAESLAAAIARHEPFRVNRRAALVAFRVPTPPPPPQPPAPQIQRPQLSLAGIAWGTGNGGGAVIEGFPGVQGPRAVRVGDVVGGIRVQQIAADSVVLVGIDTLWVLRMRRVIP